MSGDDLTGVATVLHRCYTVSVRVFLYEIMHRASGKRYVGITESLLRHRWAAHRCAARRGLGCPVLGAALRKHGPEAFIWRALEEFSTRAAACMAEVALIRETKPAYNLTPGGDGSTGFKHSAASKAKIGAASKGNKYAVGAWGAERRARHCKALTGHPVSAQGRANMSAGQKGHSVSLATRTKLAAAATGKTHSLSASGRAKVSAAHAGRVHTAEARANMSAGKKGRALTPEGRAHLVKLGQLTAGRRRSDATRAKMSAAAFAREARKRGAFG
jgi:group I intron endonuclease